MRFPISSNTLFSDMKKILVLALVGVFALNAQAVESINVQTFNPSTSDHFVFLEDGMRSEWPKVPKYLFGVNYNYVSDPLVATNGAQNSSNFNIINSIQTVDLFFGFKPTDKFAIFFGIPIDTVTYPDQPGNSMLPVGNATVLGDLKIMGKIRITDDLSPTAITLIPEFHLPTGDGYNFVSDDSTYLAIRMAIEHQFDNLTLTGNIGFATASNSRYITQFSNQNIDYRKRLLFGIGAFIPFNNAWGMNIEFSSINMIPFDKNLNPNDFYVGLRTALSESMALTFGGSIGKIGGPTGQTFRGVAGLRYTFFDEDAEKKNREHPQRVADTSTVLPAATPFPSINGPTPVAPIAAAPILPTYIAGHGAVMKAKRIELLYPISFENESARITGDSVGVLNDVAAILKKNQKSYKKILIDGHTSSIGDDAYNVKLSLARSKAVKAYLVKTGIPANKLFARGFGRRVPKVSYAEPRAAEINRRVEFIVQN
jgi:outer membrane protein OmpA-like peptidoglycan-associated protein